MIRSRMSISTLSPYQHLYYICLPKNHSHFKVFLVKYFLQIIYKSMTTFFRISCLIVVSLTHSVSRRKLDKRERKNKMNAKMKMRFAALLAVVLLGGVTFAEEAKVDAAANSQVAAQASPEKGKNKKSRVKGESRKRNLAIVIDRSAGVNARRFEQIKTRAKERIEKLTAEEIVSLVAFGEQVEVLAPARMVNEDVKKDLIEKINSLKKDKSAATFAGVSKGADEIRKNVDKKLDNRIVVFSANNAEDVVGPSGEDTFERLEAALKKEQISIVGLSNKPEHPARKGKRPAQRREGRGKNKAK